MATIMAATVSSDGERSATSKFLNQDAVAARQSAWQLEMEREQLQSWLQHSLLPQQTSTFLPQLAQHPWADAARHAALFGGDGRRNPTQAVRHDGDSHRADAGQVPYGSGLSDADGRAQTIPSRDISGIETNEMVPTSGRSIAMTGASEIDEVASENKSSDAATRLMTVADALQKLLSELAGPSLQLLWNSRNMALPSTAANTATAEEQENDSTETDSAGVQANSREENFSTANATAVDGKNAENAVHAALRFHTEADGSSAKIWIGADGSLALTQANLLRLGDEIGRLLGQQGMRLASLVCNGTPVLRNRIDRAEDIVLFDDSDSTDQRRRTEPNFNFSTPLHALSKR